MISKLRELANARGVKRSDIGGFTLTLAGYALKVVTAYRLPCCLALSRGLKTFFRIEWGTK